MKDTFGRRNRTEEENFEQEGVDEDVAEQKEIESPTQQDKENSAAIDNNFKKEEIARHKQIRRDSDDDIGSITIGLEDIDETIKHQFDENFNFHVVQNDESIQVPTIYNTRERWEWARANQKLRTVHDKVVFPLIVFERTDVSRDSNYSNMNTINQQVFGQGGSGDGSTFIASTKYSKRNKYNSFGVLNNERPQREFYVVSSPNYVEIEYDFQIFTEYMFQMNKIIEKISYLSKEYWGDPDDNLFRTRVNSISTSVEIDNEVRFAKGEFSATVYGYLLPEHVAESATTKKAFTISEVEFDEKIVSAQELEERD